MRAEERGRGRYATLPILCRVEDEVVKRLHSTFSAETNTRDDETHMYVCVWACPGHVEIV